MGGAFTRRKSPFRTGAPLPELGQLDDNLYKNAMDVSGRGGLPLRNDITMAEVRQHNTEHDCWTVLQGKVYNLSPYLAYHPGGADILLRAAGEDATNMFEEVCNLIRKRVLRSNLLMIFRFTHGVCYVFFFFVTFCMLKLSCLR